MASLSSPLGRRECVVPTVQCCVRINTAIEHFFQRMGWFVSEHPLPVLVVNVLVLIGLCFGLAAFELETNIFDLWAPTDSPIWDENEFIETWWSDTQYGALLFASYAKTGFNTNLLETKYIQEWFELHLDMQVNLPKMNITVTDSEGTEHEIEMGYYMEDYYPIQTLDELSNLTSATVPHYNSRVVPLCRHFATSPLEAQFQLPCFILTVLDCFTEGGYSFPYENYLSKTLVTAILPTNPYSSKPSFQDMTSLELGAVLAPSCEAWSGTVIPSNYIYGGETRTDPEDPVSQITSVNSFESVAFVDSSFGLARKIKIATGQCTYTAFYSYDCGTPTDEEKEEAAEIIFDWLELYIDYFEDVSKTADNSDDKYMKLVFWTPRTSGDLLRSASAANFGLLGIAYGAMIIFASLIAFRPALFLSRTEASCTGVLLVLLAVLATMGTGALFVKFSPNVVQVLPFIALGFGVDDMFVILFSFKYRESLTIRDMIGEATRLAGSSVAMTSTSNFFAFLVGSFMVLPDVARFATFGMIIVVLNFFTVLLGFTAIMTLTARRMAARYNDCAFLCCFAEFTKSQKTQSERHNEAHVFDPFFDFMTNDYTRICGFLGFFALAGLGIYGCSLAQLGLPLADIVPEGTYAGDFLEVRTRFYFSYVVNLYTDADGKNVKLMDWPNKFETWINATEDIYSLSDLVYEDDGVHDFWAWNMRDYLSDIWDLTFAPYEPAYLTADPNITRKSATCETDRANFCPSLLVNYSLGSDIYSCMMYNYDSLSEEGCQLFLDGLTDDSNFTTIIARQVEIIITGEDNAEGIYIASSENDVNVYYKLEGEGLLFQYPEEGLDTDGTWIVLDGNYEAIYFGLGTETDNTQPPQYGWTDAAGKLQPLTVIYWDETLYEYYRSPLRFVEYDIDVPTEFVFNYSVTSGNTADTGACFAWDAMKIAMSNSTDFVSVSLGSQDDSNAIFCDEGVEATDICYAIAQEEELNTTRCSDGFREFYDLIGYYEFQNTSGFAAGYCEGSGYTIVAASDGDVDADIPGAQLCFCSDPSSADTLSGTGVDYNFVSPCTADSGTANYGATGLTSGDAASQCGAQDEDFLLECNARDCQDMDSCRNDLQRIWASGEDTSSCGDITVRTIVLSSSRQSRHMTCLTNNWDSLSYCCQQGIINEVQQSTVTTCSALSTKNGGAGGANVCHLRDNCDANCNTLCYDDDTANCGKDIAEHCLNVYNAGNGSDVVDCINSLSSSQKHECCKSGTFQDWEASCPIVPATYWNYEDKKFDYTAYCALDDIPTVCNTTDYTYDTLGQMICMIENVDSMSEGCCKRVVQISTPTYSLTHDCQADALRVTGSNSWELDESEYQQLATFIWDADEAPEDISYTCAQSLTQCPGGSEWPTSEIGDEVTIDCALGYSGTRTRRCGSKSYNALAAEWGAADESGCVKLTCPAERHASQEWEETKVGEIRFYYGDSNAVTANTGDWRGSSCSGFTVAWVQRECRLNSANNTAQWQDAIGACKGQYPQWSSTETVVNASCVGVSSLVEVYDAGAEYTEYDAQYDACQSECNFLDNCQGFIFHEDTAKCDMYDLCYPEKGAGPGTDTFVWNILTLDAHGGWYCLNAYNTDLQNQGQAGELTFEQVQNRTVSDTRRAWSEEGIPFPGCFNTTIFVYFVNPVGGTLYRDKVSFNNLAYLYDDNSYRFGDMFINGSSNSFSVQGIDDDTVAVQLILDTRDRLAEWEKEQLYVIPGGLVFDLFSQYVGVEESLITNLLYVSIAVVVTGFAFLLNWWAVLIMLLCNAAMIVEVYGFVEWLGLRVNGVLVLNIVIAVGLTMEFTAHIGRAFVLTKATKMDHERGVALPFATDGQVRMKKMYREMFNPVTMGAITTFLGVLPISLAEFPYFRQYYFVLYVVIVLFGWLNGVIFQPIFLSLLPPEPFDEEPLSDDEEPLTKSVQAEAVEEAGKTDTIQSTGAESEAEQGDAQTKPESQGYANDDDQKETNE